MLSENDIKRAFSPFLRQFYKYRYEYQPGSIESEIDKVSAGGLIADGMVSFRKEDGEMFVCTFEATSVDKADEVKYKLNVVYFTWDCLAFGALIAALAYVIAYVYYLPWLAKLQWTGNLGFVLGMGIAGFLMWFFTMRNWRKYRYIYAIEQFKRYFATEQWVALADDVFPAPTDPYLLELKSQCVYNGFGLALVPEKGEIRVLNAPSRLGIYGKDRKMVQWVTRRQWFQAVSDNVKTLGQQYRPAPLPDGFTQQWNKVWHPIQYYFWSPFKRTLWRSFSSQVGENNAVLDRYMRGQSVQKWLFVLSLVLTTTFAYQVLNMRQDDVQDVIFHPDENPEDQYGYLYEGPNAKKQESRGVPKQYPEPVKSAEPEEIPTINLSGDNDQDEIPTIDISGIEDETPAASNDPCAPFRAAQGWIIQDNTFPTKSQSEERLATLKQKGLVGTIIPKNCLGEGTGFLLQLGPVFSSQSVATAQASNYANALERYGLLGPKPIVRRIN